MTSNSESAVIAEDLRDSSDEFSRIMQHAACIRFHLSCP